jgi:hypothetical protein
MTKIKHIQLVAVAVCLSISQLGFSQIIFFKGVGRAIVTNQNLKGEAVKNDTLTSKNTMGGYTLFDLGINVLPSKKVHANVVLRAKNPFGRFFGKGSAISFREFQIRGVLSKGVFYELGDIDIALTPYTVFNNDEIYNTFESSMFARRRAILNYENFNHGNKWRTQGVQSDVSFKVRRLPIDHLAAYGFATRSRTSDNFTIPDRYLTGGNLKMIKDSLLMWGFNYTGFLDNPSKGDTYDYNNHVLTTDLSIQLTKGKNLLFIEGETGQSSMRYKDLGLDSTISYKDFFYDAKIKLKQANKFQLVAGFREVGPQFTSPSAQTQRINPSSIPATFPTILQNQVNRGQILFDRLGQEGLYNQTITPVLNVVQPLLNNAMPYGDATPNRRGVYFKFNSLKDTATFVRYELNAAMLNEIIGEGTLEKRNFLLAYGGTKLMFNKLLAWDKEVALNLGFKYENSSREGKATTDISSTLLDLGVDVEPFNKLFLRAGVKSLVGSGKEFLAQRDGFNNIGSFSLYNVDLSETILAAGMSYMFNEFSVVSLDYNNVKSANKIDKNQSYTLGQLFINYSMSF